MMDVTMDVAFLLLAAFMLLDPLRYITQRYTRAIETFVRKNPLQYLWIHRRWKSRPKNEIAQKFD
jgi:lauroyl/myristoyl acyltransferase